MAKTLSPPVQLLCELIALPSVNPAFVTPGDPHAGEARVTDFVASLGATEGLSLDFQEVVPGRRNLLLHYRPSGRVSRRIVLAPHLDTVGSLDGSEEIFQPKIEGGRVWGRGACDTKGSVAAMLTALFEVVRSPERPKATEIIFAGLIDEESNQQGSRALVNSGFRADFGIVGEPTRLDVVTAHKGDIWARLGVRGKAAHGACPDRGVNAVRAMAAIVEALEGPYAKAIAKRRHPLLGSPTINVGLIQGGMQPNIVPDHCVIEIDRRTLPGETGPGVRREMLRFLKDRGLKVSFADLKGVPAPALETDPGLPAVREFMASVGRQRALGVHYFCDAAILAMGGTPCVVFGPGDIAQAHTAREWISIASLERGTAMLRRYLQSLP
ncbi:MAG: M20 family metallopeptidase [Verrucomicrobiales bacterium]|nr:M20 family metallopeptidase [Verrucomicrobiales bacterium]